MLWMRTEAAKYNMQIGLKNSLDILADVSSFVDFAVNEQCAQLGECQTYANFLALNKPVFQIEYPQPLNAQAVNGASCKGVGVAGMSTILKNLQLDGITYYCDGSYVDTPTVGGTSPGRPSQPPRPVPTPSRSSTRTSTTTVRPITTPRPTTTPSRTSTTQRPTSTPGGGGGCRSKHWDQCGGQNWNGCTVCEVCTRRSRLTCKIIANLSVCDSRRIRAKACRRRTITSVCSYLSLTGMARVPLIHHDVPSSPYVCPVHFSYLPAT
jgi:hypothetical protein